MERLTLDILMIMCGLGAIHFFFLAWRSLNDKH